MKSQAQDMGSKTQKVFQGNGSSVAATKMYKDSIGVFANVISERLGIANIPTSYGSLADFGSFSGEFLGNLKEKLLSKNISFKKVIALEVNEEALSKNDAADEKITSDLISIPVDDNAFDISTARYVLHWNSLERQNRIIQEIIRTTKLFAVIQYPTVESSGQQKKQELFKGEIISALKRDECYFGTQEEVEQLFKNNDIAFELADNEKVDDVSDILIERYNLSDDEAKTLKAFLGEDDYWKRTTWVISK